MNTPDDSQLLHTILAEVRQIGRQVNRLRWARFGAVSALCVVFAGLGALGSYIWLNRHTLSAAISIQTEAYTAKSGNRIVAVTVSGPVGYDAKQSLSDDKNRQTITCYFPGQ